MNPLRPVILTAAAAAFTASARADLLVQELWDAVAGPPPGTDVTLNGIGDTAASAGMTGTWLTNGSTGIFTASNFNIDGGLPGLPSNAGQNGGLWNNVANWNTSVYATRPLAVPVDLAVPQTIYFSVRLRNEGDTALGLGLAAGPNGSAEFLGAGLTWNNATGVDGQNASNSLHLSAGTLDQNLTGNNDGPYAIIAHTAPGTINGRCLVVGRLILDDAGADHIDLKLYLPGEVIENDLGLIQWSLSETFASSMSATHLLLWMNGSGNGELDAIRIGTTWQDVTGVTEVTSPQFLYWDTNGATAGAGGEIPDGDWTDASWSASATGEDATGAWAADAAAVFAAGADATGKYAVDLGASTQSAKYVWAQEGDVTLTGGTLNLLDGGLLRSDGTFLEVASTLTAASLTTQGNVMLSGTATASGALTIASGTLQVQVPLTVAGLAGTGTLEMFNNELVVGGAADSYFGGVLSGTADVTKQGTGTLTLAGTNAFGGQMTVSEGTLAAANASALGTATLGTTVSAGATLNVPGITLTAGETITVAGTGAAGRDSALINTNAGANTFIPADLVLSADASIGGGGGADICLGTSDQPRTISSNGGPFTLTKTGANRVWFRGLADGAGNSLAALVINQGTFGIEANDNALNALPVTVHAGGALSSWAKLVVDDPGPPAVTHFEASTQNNPITLDGGALGSDYPGQAWTGAVTLTADSTLGAINSAQSFTIAGAVGETGGPWGLTKTLGGTVTLTASNTYSGATIVTAGTLAVTGSIANSAVTVDAGATLAAAGTGALCSSLTVNAGGYLAIAVAATPGAQPAQTVTGALTWDPDASLDLTAAAPPAAGDYTLITATGGISAAPTIVNLPMGTNGSVALVGNSLVLTVEPAGFAGWITGTFANGSVPAGQQGPTDDPDGDGLDNLMEYALEGLDPTAADGPAGTLVGTTLTFAKRQPLAADITYAIEESTDLGLTDPWEVVAADQTDTTISYTLPGGPARDFMRLKVTQN